MSLVDKLGQSIQIGDRVMYPVGCADIGYELGFETGEVTAIPTPDSNTSQIITIHPDRMGVSVDYWLIRMADICTVLNPNNPHVTLFLLENSIS